MKFKTKISALILVLLLIVPSLFCCQTRPYETGIVTESMESEAIATDSTEHLEEPSDQPLESDPYTDITKEIFYADYTPATSYQDACYRTQHFLMSGSLDQQDQKPTVAQNQPRENGILIRNTAAVYKDNGNTYIVFDADGNEAFRVYKGGGYITLEEVAAYVYAFGEIPANYVSKKSAKPTANPWGQYLRVNHSSFFGDTNKYPYEPELPEISGCGGTLCYFEIDIGTTGTDCDPNYIAKIYNDGSKITRGAARIVYTRHDTNNNKIIDPNERFVFYTYNHYNDFQEYLNYEGGWGEIFGNITGGGTISSKTNFNPTPYIPVIRRDLTVKNRNISMFFYDQKYFFRKIV